MQLLVSNVVEYPTASFVLVMAFFAWFGNFIVTHYLIDKQIRNYLSKIVFVITFMCSVGLLAMYLYQISDLAVDRICWNITLFVLVVMCVLVIPINLIMRLPYANFKLHIFGKQVPLGMIVLLLCYFQFLRWTAKQRSQSSGIFEELVNESLNELVQIVVNYGVYIMALMSAYGTVWCPYIYLNFVATQRPLLAEAKKKTLKEVHFIIDQIKINKGQLLLLEEKREKLANKIVVRNADSTRKGLIERGLTKMIALLRDDLKKELNDVDKEIDFHRSELETLKKVHQESFQVYRQLVDEERKHLLSDTFVGKFFRVSSFVLAVYSVTRIVLTLWNIVKGRKLSTDPITRLLSLIELLVHTDVDNKIMRYSQYISFGFMGYLMISSVRSFSMNVKNLFDFILRRRRLNILETDTRVFFLSLIYGIYFLSAVVLLQSGLPKEYVSNFELITGKVSLVDHFTLFDKVFSWCCLLSIAFILFSEFQGKKRMNFIIKERNIVDCS